MGTAPQPDRVVEPCFAVGRKDIVTTSLGSAGLWATAAQGMPSEVFWPSPGDPQIKDIGVIVASSDHWYEVKAEENYTVAVPDPRVPLATITHTGPPQLPYRLVLRLAPDPRRDALLIEYELTGVADAQCYVMCATRLQGDHGLGRDALTNHGWTDGGRLFASDGGRFLCMDAVGGFTRTSVGYYGVSDLWHDFADDGRMTWEYTDAGPGPIVLGGQLAQTTGTLLIALADTAEAARDTARQSLTDGSPSARDLLAEQWLGWATGTRLPDARPDDPPELAAALQWSATTIRVHQDRGRPGRRPAGAIVAGLCKPWGDTGTEAGYFLVWPRDACEAASALLAVGHVGEAEELFTYLLTQQSDDGHWRQNFFPDGTDYWAGTQLDETALPVLLAAALDDAGRSPDADTRQRLRQALGFIARNGPRSDQDRWEEDPGTSPFSLGTAIAALVAGARYLDDPLDRQYALELADFWCERIEELTYVTGSYLDTLFRLGGHYVRIGPANPRGVLIKNRDGALYVPTAGVLGLEFAYLARLGLRAAGSAPMADTVTLVDALLGRQTGVGVAYHRYNFDGYGELIDGRNWDDRHGLGRPWPLLAGERGHYEVAANRSGLDQLRTMLQLRSESGYVPEQAWDQPPLRRIPQSERSRVPDDVVQPSASLYLGRPTLSATPLVWGHAELIKLACARAAGTPLERRPDVVDHFATEHTPDVHWRRWHPFTEMPRGRALVIEDVVPFAVTYRLDDGPEQNRDSSAGRFGLHDVTLDPSDLQSRRTIDFRFGSNDGTWRITVTDQPRLHLGAHSDPRR